ncbi:MAG: hypothetical protein ABR907_07410 [Terracidiphilus sp.]|jgi:hypothetical protein
MKRSQEKRLTERRCYHHIEMKPESVGRVLGVGLRVAGRIAGERIAASAQNSGRQQAAAAVAAGGTAVQGKAGRPTAGGLARGVGGFLKPFRRIGGILWLEVTGGFFLLPVVVFAPTLWRVRRSWAEGPDHRLFLATAGVMAVFLYLSVSSFWRARRR